MVTDDLVRDVLTRVADRWTLDVIEALDGAGPTRFSALEAKLAGISQKMLTKTLRQLERDGLVTRRVFPEVPPRVEYELTASGSALGKAVCAVWDWAIAFAADVERARAAFDAHP